MWPFDYFKRDAKKFPLSAESVRFSYSEQEVLQDITLNVKEGATVVDSIGLTAQVSESQGITDLVTSSLQWLVAILIVVAIVLGIALLLALLIIVLILLKRRKKQFGQIWNLIS